MIRSLLSSQSQSITGAAILLGVASFVSRFIGILRDRLFTHLFGAGDVLDAYYAAFRLPDLVYTLLLVGALSAGFIPIFTELWQENRARAWAVCNNVLNLVGIALLLTSGVLFVFTPTFTLWLVPGFEGEKLQLTILLTRIMLISPLILGLSSVVSSTLQSLKQFFIYALTPIVYNLGIMVGALVFVPLVGVIGLGFGVIVGAVFHLLIQLPALYHQGWRYQATISPKEPKMREIIRLVIPRALGLASQQINLMIMTTLASTLTIGSVAVFHLANHLQSFPIGIVGLSVAMAAFPSLAAAVAQKDTTGLVAHLSQSIRMVLFVIIPTTILFLLLRAQIVRVVFGSGSFDWEDTILTADTLAFFALSLFAQSLIPLLARASYALKNTWVPLLISVISVAVNIALAILFKRHVNIPGVPGLALAFSLAMILQCTLLWVWLRIRIGSLDEFRTLRTVYKMSVAAILMAPSVQLLKIPLAAVVDMTRFWGIFTQGLGSGLAGLFIYGVACYLLRVEELDIFLASLKRRWLKLRQTYVDVADHE